MQITVKKIEKINRETYESGTLADIDTDYSGLRRDEVKKYIIERFGYNQVCYVGTHGTLGLKSILKDLGKDKGIDFSYMNYVTASIEQREDWKWWELFEYAQANPTVKKFIHSYPELINDIYPILGQPKSLGIHASAVIVTPEEDEFGRRMELWDWFPVYKNSEGMLISEWSGTALDKAGFLKHDILGIEQLDKIARIKQLIDKNNNIDFDLFGVPFDDERVYQLFSEGLSQDVFHLGSNSLRTYTKRFKPTNRRDLSTILAIHRPGTMSLGLHNKIVDLRDGKIEPDYDWGTQEVLKENLGMLIYQEDVTALAVTLANFNPDDAEDVRKAIGKKILSLMQSYKIKFIDGCVNNGCEQAEAEKIWGKIEEFAAYGFNRSHSITYSSLGYLCQFLKVNHPLEFWTASLEFAPKEEILQRIAEMNKVSKNITLAPPDINSSTELFAQNIKEQKIYWSLARVIQCGPSALKAILDERNLNGEFFSVKEFFERVPKKLVRKPAMVNLILSGSFDEMYMIDDVRVRYEVLKEYCALNKVKIDEIIDPQLRHKKYYWIYRQLKACQYGYFDYKELSLIEAPQIYSENYNITFQEPLDFFNPLEKDEQRKNIAIGGILTEMVVRNSKTRGAIVSLTIDCNGDLIPVTLWDECYSTYQEELEQAKDKIIFVVNGIVKLDTFRNRNNCYSCENTKIYFLDC